MRRTNVGLALQNISRSAYRDSQSAQREDSLRGMFAQRTTLNSISRSVLGDFDGDSVDNSEYDGGPTQRIGRSKVQSSLTSDDPKLSKILIKLSDVEGITSESLHLLQKTPFLEESTAPKYAEKMNSIDDVRDSIQEIVGILSRKEKSADVGLRASKVEPLTSETLLRKEGESKGDFSRRRKEVKRAEEIMKYGGTSPIKKFMFGLRASSESETAAKTQAMNFANKEQVQEAQRILFPEDMKEVDSTAKTSSLAEEKKQAALQLEARSNLMEEAEAQEDFREDLLERLEKIEKKLDDIEQESKSGSMISSILKGILGIGATLALLKGIPATLAALAATVGRIALAKAGAAVRAGAAAAGRIARGAGPAAKSIGRAALGLARIAGPVGLAVTAATGVYGGVKGAMDVRETLGIEDNEEVTLRQRLAGAAGGAAGALSFGLADSESITRRLAESRDEMSQDSLESRILETNPEILNQEEVGNVTENAREVEPSKRRRGGGARSSELATPESIPEDLSPEQAILRDTMENQQLRNEAASFSTQTQLQPIVINNTLPVSIPSQDTGSTAVILTRNPEPTLATYNASIFDHPVVHPGLFRM